MWAIGMYTRVTQIAEKTIHELNFIRSATEPEISATVMIANVAWKAIATRAGTPEPAIRLWSSVIPLEPKYSKGLPMMPPMSVPNAPEYPYSNQIGAMRAIAPKLIIIMFSTVLPRTMPP